MGSEHDSDESDGEFLVPKKDQRHFSSDEEPEIDEAQQEAAKKKNMKDIRGRMKKITTDGPL